MAKTKKAKTTKNGRSRKTVESIRHTGDTRKNIPSAEYQSVLEKNEAAPRRVNYPRNTDLDPQLVWREKDEQDWTDLIVHAPSLFIQEKVHPKVLIEDLLRHTNDTHAQVAGAQTNLFGDFNGISEGVDRTEFYQHDANWSNRMILGDSLQVMASLAEREGLRGKVQCIYIDPPYGIKFNSNFQWSTTSRDVKDGKADHITREPEQVKAFRDTWRDGIHSYLTYLRERLTVARDLLTESGSIFVQIGDDNVHRIRAVIDEVFGEENFIQTIVIKKKSSAVVTEPVNDFVVWVAKKRQALKIRALHERKDTFSERSRFSKLELADLTRIDADQASESQIANPDNRLMNDDYPMVSQDPQQARIGAYRIQGEDKFPGKNRHWTLDPDEGMRRLEHANRLRPTTRTVRGVIYVSDFGQEPLNNIWEFHGERDPIYVVQTNKGIAQRCVLMTTDPGDLVLDPTCGSGTTAYVAEQWGRRWITIDTSRVALALARARIMGARYPYYLLTDSRDGQVREATLSHNAPSEAPTYNNIRQGFVYERVPHITLNSIANNAEIDVIWEKFQNRLEPLRVQLNAALNRAWEDWEIPRKPGAWSDAATTSWDRLRVARTDAEKAATLRALNKALGRDYALADVPKQPHDPWKPGATDLHRRWWEQRIARQQEIDASIASKAEVEYLHDRPYEDKRKVRVAGPFTVESLSPHRMLGVDENDELIDPFAVVQRGPTYGMGQGYEQMILVNLSAAGVQQGHKDDRIVFTSLVPWPGSLISAEGRYRKGETERRAGILIGPEFGTVGRPDLVAAAREAGDAGFDALIACAFNFEAHASEFSKLGRIPVLKARMNADLHMAGDLKATDKGNLFVVFGEPDIEPIEDAHGRLQVRVKGVDVFDPSTGEVRSDSADGIACWFIDTDYNEESFFVRHAYFLGQNDPYRSLKTTLKAEIDAEAWATLHSDTSRLFDRPTSGRYAVKVINHLGDEVMKVFRV